MVCTRPGRDHTEPTPCTAGAIHTWWHAAVCLEHALQAARSLGAGTAEARVAGMAVRGLERAKWRLWHGRTGRGAGADEMRRQVTGLLGYLGRNKAAPVPYAARRQGGEAIATSFVESAVDEIIAWRMTKKQQMRWSRTTVPFFLDVRTAVLNGTLEDAFCRRHPDFRSANDNRGPTATAA